MKKILTNKTIYHKTTVGGFIHLLQNYDGSFLCCSTEDSEQLITKGQLEIVLKFKQIGRTGIYSSVDFDAGKNFGYDEFRTEFQRSKIYCEVHKMDFEGLDLNEIEKIIVSPEVYEILENVLDGEGQEEEELNYLYESGLLELIFPFLEKSENKFFNF